MVVEIKPYLVDYPERDGDIERTTKMLFAIDVSPIERRLVLESMISSMRIIAGDFSEEDEQYLVGTLEDFTPMNFPKRESWQVDVAKVGKLLTKALKGLLNRNYSKDDRGTYIIHLAGEMLRRGEMVNIDEDQLQDAILDVLQGEF